MNNFDIESVDGERGGLGNEEDALLSVDEGHRCWSSKGWLGGGEDREIAETGNDSVNSKINQSAHLTFTKYVT